MYNTLLMNFIVSLHFYYSGLSLGEKVFARTKNMKFIKINKIKLKNLQSLVKLESMGIGRVGL